MFNIKVFCGGLEIKLSEGIKSQFTLNKLDTTIEKLFIKQLHKVSYCKAKLFVFSSSI